MRKLSHVLHDAIDRREVLRAARAQRILRRWPEIVGEALAARSTPDSFDRGTVWVSVTGSAWANELRMLVPTLLERIAELANDPTLVVELRFGVRPPRPKPEGVSPRVRTVDPELEQLSISEIKERRLKRWADEEGAKS